MNFLKSEAEMERLLKIWLAGLKHEEAMQSRIFAVPPQQAKMEGKPYLKLNPEKGEWVDFLFHRKAALQIPVEEDGQSFLKYLHKKEETARRFRQKVHLSLYFMFPVILHKNGKGPNHLGSLFRVECPEFDYPSSHGFGGKNVEPGTAVFTLTREDEPEIFGCWLDGFCLEKVLKIHDDDLTPLRKAANDSHSLGDFLEKIFPLLFEEEIKEGLEPYDLLKKCCELLQKKCAQDSAGQFEIFPFGLLCDFDKGMVTSQLQNDLTEMIDYELLGKLTESSPARAFLMGGETPNHPEPFHAVRHSRIPLATSQNEARQKTTECGITTIKGPPGSGKTHLIKSILGGSIYMHAKSLSLEEEPKAGDYLALLASVNNQAVDQAMAGMEMKGLLPATVRLGNYSKLEQITLPFLQNYYRELCMNDESEGRELFEKYQALLNDDDDEDEYAKYELARKTLHAWVIARQRQAMELLMELIQDLQRRKGLKAFYRKKNYNLFFSIFPVFGCTLLSLRNALKLNQGMLHTLIIDEAGQCLPSYAFPALFRSRNAVCLGDTLQLEPIATMTQRDWSSLAENREGFTLPESLADFLPNEDETRSVQHLMQAFSGNNACTLGEHYRCRREIVDVMVELCGYRLDVYTPPPEKEGPLGETPLWYLDHSGIEEQYAGSWFNATEANIVSELVQNLVEQGCPPSKIAVITPYRGQYHYIMRALRKRKLYAQSGNNDQDTGESLLVGTVHRFQGGEREIVLFSNVNSRRDPLFLNSKVNLLNVAVSRAMHHFVYVGSMENLKRGFHTSILHKHLIAQGQAYRLTPKNPVFETSTGQTSLF